MLENLTPIVKAETTPDYLWVADKPLSLGGIPKKMPIEEINKLFGIEYTEGIYTAKSSYNFGHEPNYVREWAKISSFLRNPKTDRFVICFINEEVGYGVFAREEIPAGEMVAIYAGVVVSNSGNRYSMAITSPTHPTSEINAAQVRGVAGFFQHLPYREKDAFDALEKAARDPDKIDLLLAANGIIIDTPPSASFRQASLSGNFQFTTIFRNLSAKSAPFSEEINSITILPPYTSTLATANVQQSCVFYKGKIVSFFSSIRTIQPGEQIGFSYTTDYWKPQNKWPRYFDTQGKPIPFFNIKIKKDLFNGLQPLFTKYETTDVNIAFRKASYTGNLADVLFLFSFIENINAKGAQSYKTALHLSIIQGHITVATFLIRMGARSDLKDATGKTAKDYAESSTNPDIKSLFQTQAPTHPPVPPQTASGPSLNS